MGGIHIEPGIISIAIRQVFFRAPGFGDKNWTMGAEVYQMEMPAILILGWCRL